MAQRPDACNFSAIISDYYNASIIVAKPRNDLLP